MSSIFSKFNAEKYDKYRPEYPKILRDKLVGNLEVKSELNILDIGCGTGKSAILFGDISKNLVLLDPSENMLKIAKKKFKNNIKASFSNNTFEEFKYPNESFHLIISGQAFHWIDQEKGYLKVRNLLIPYGLAAFFWNAQKKDTDFSIEENKIYVKHFGERAIGSHEIQYTKSLNGLKEEIKKYNNIFEKVAILEISNEYQYSEDEYLELQKTYTSYKKMPEKSRNEIFDEIKHLIREMGGTIKVPYVCTTIILRKGEK